MRRPMTMTMGCTVRSQLLVEVRGFLVVSGHWPMVMHKDRAVSAREA